MEVVKVGFRVWSVMGKVKCYFTDFVRNGGGGGATPQIREPLFAKLTWGRATQGLDINVQIVHEIYQQTP